jgi:hypothetical protein
VPEDAAQINPGPRLERTTFSRSRLLDFCSEKELVAQAGHPKEEWPLVILKEGMDNALDAIEEAGHSPEITVNVKPSEILIADNGPGLPAATIKKIIDYGIRVSSREAYVSTTRGAQGNALKCLLAMPFVLDGERGRVEIEANDTLHDLTFRVDKIRQEPVIDHPVAKIPDPSPGTRLRIHWPADRSTGCQDDEENSYEWSRDKPSKILVGCRERFLQIVSDYTFLNPHLTLRLQWFDEPEVLIERTNPAWLKWSPSWPTSAHWYQPEHLGNLIAAYVTHDADNGRVRLVREFVAEFKGLSASAKQRQVLEATGLSRSPMTDLVDHEAGELHMDRVAALLDAMKNNSKPVKQADLGLIGEDHLRRRVEEAGGAMEFFRYKAVKNVTKDGLPYVMEMAFAPKKGAFTPSKRGEWQWRARRRVTGVNWSPGITDPFRTLGGECSSLASQLHQRMCGEHEQIILVLNLAQPRPRFTDRAKSAIVL